MSLSTTISISPRTALCLALAVCMLLPGCVRRRLMVRSNPPGAMVYVDNQPIGTTPCATDFVYYGTREIRLVKPGYETLAVNQPIPVPWFEIPPIDFVSENVVPRKIQDYRTVTYNLVPQVIVPTEQLLGRAEELRQSTLQGTVLPAAATSVPGISTSVLPAAPTLPPPAAGAELFSPPATTLPPGGQPLEPLPTP
jgi:PEGA domain